jgi:hypothetical protein
MASQSVASMFAVAILIGVFASVPKSDSLSLSIFLKKRLGMLYFKGSSQEADDAHMARG